MHIQKGSFIWHFAVVIFAIISLFTLASIGQNTLGDFGEFISLLIVVVVLFRFAGPSHKSVGLKPDYLIIGVQTAIFFLIFFVIMAVGKFLSESISVILFLLLIIFSVWAAQLRDSKLKRWEVWHADVPFTDKDDSKMRPVVVIGSQHASSSDAKIRALYVTSQDRDASPQFRAVDPFQWDFGHVDDRKHRSWVRVTDPVLLPLSAFDRKIGGLTAQESKKLTDALDHTWLEDT